MKLKFNVLLFLFLLSHQARSERHFDQSLKDLAISNLKYIRSEQIQSSNQLYHKGEWPTDLESTLLPAAVGVGKLFGKNQEASGFTTASIINQLSDIYLSNLEFQNELSDIPLMIRDGVSTFSRYKEGDLYNFYPLKEWKGTLVRQPVDMKLAKIWKGFTNIPADADTSSVVYTASYYDSLINNKELEIPESVFQSFSSYRDLKRKPMFYNKSQGDILTGAFMTWQFDEESPQRPSSSFAPPEMGQRIPFESNDVDCIVNMNVVRLIHLTGHSKIEGYKEACSWVEKIITEDKNHSCGVYYPNTLNLAYSVANTLVSNRDTSNNNLCVSDEKKELLVKKILSLHLPNGAWENSRNVWKDEVQSTVFALNALLKLANPHDPKIKKVLDEGVAFLVRNIKIDKNGSTYLKGEMFFTATALARSMVIWKSNSYTTALASSVFLKMHKLFPAQDLMYYHNIPYEFEFPMSSGGA